MNWIGEPADAAHPGGSVWEALVVRLSNRRFYGDLLQRLRTRALPTEKKAT